MTDRRPVTPLKRVLAWVLFLAAAAAWLFSGELFPGNSRLYQAIDTGDAYRVRQLLAAGADPNSQRTPLTLTRTSAGRLRRYQVSPLVFALRRNKPDVALVLVEAGADPNARDLDGKSALALAAGEHMTDVERALLARGARLPTVSPVGR